ncbi:MAG: Histidine kinase [Lacunisphaera sp.]|nr:Histidine kinase [Lacunisphaera sp.]
MISIRRQLTRRLLGTTLGLLGLGLAGLLAVACYAVVRQFDLALRTKALAISTVAVTTAETVRVEFTDRFLQGFDDKRPRDFFQMWLTDGQTLARSESLGEADLPQTLGTLEKPRYFLCTLPTGRPGRAIGFSFRPKPARGVTRLVDVELVVASDREDLDSTLLQLLGLAAGCGALLLGATLWVVPRVLRRGLEPLDRLGEQAARIDAGSLAARFPLAELPEELQAIGRRLNDLLARLEHSFERERRFSGDLAHELRTPIAELRSLAECALKWPESRDEATDTDVLAIARHMEALTVSMLALARGERLSSAAPLQPVDATALVHETWRPFAARAQERRLQVEFALAPSVVPADPVLLRSVLTNLFDNAVDYTPEGGTIRIAFAGAEPDVAFSVGNPAGNLEAADAPKLFDPFWRKEAARSGGHHVGLGLSLSRTFAAAMGWTLSATHDGGQLVLRLARGRAALVTPA